MLRRPSRRGNAASISLRAARNRSREVLDRWLAPDHRYFKLRGDDGDVYIIRHDVHAGLWELTMFERGTRR